MTLYTLLQCSFAAICHLHVAYGNNSGSTTKSILHSNGKSHRFICLLYVSGTRRSWLMCLADSLGERGISAIPTTHVSGRWRCRSRGTLGWNPAADDLRPYVICQYGVRKDLRTLLANPTVEYVHHPSKSRLERRSAELFWRGTRHSRGFAHDQNPEHCSSMDHPSRRRQHASFCVFQPYAARHFRSCAHLRN